MPDVTTRDIDEWSRIISAALGTAALTRTNETELREDVDHLIRAAAADLYGLADYSVTAERRSRRVERRHYDKAYGGLIVEWEWDMTTLQRRSHAAEQALQYLSDVRRDCGDESAFSAIVCDGSVFGFLAHSLRPQLDLFEDAIPLRAEEHFEWRTNTPASCRRFLQLLGSNTQAPVTASALSGAFGSNSDLARVIVPLFIEQIRGRQSADRSDTLLKEWRRLIEVVYGELDDATGEMGRLLRETFGIHNNATLGEIMFAVQTYFALVARLIALEVLSVSYGPISGQPSHWSTYDDRTLQQTLSDLEGGRLQTGLAFENLFEGDVFSWYIGLIGGNISLCNALRDILDRIGHFAFPRVTYGISPAVDVLRDLYQGLFPRVMRSALGEFLTPQWLADACLERLSRLGITLNQTSILDPTCGTGTFLVPLVKLRASRLRARLGDSITREAVQGLLDSVAGLDINPIAVIATRVNFILSLGDLATIPGLRLPVWRADSILTPSSAPLQIGNEDPDLRERDWLRLQTSLDVPFPIPPTLASQRRMALLRRILEDALSEDDHDTALQEFLIALTAAFGPAGHTCELEGQEWENTRIVATVLYRQIRVLKESGRDGVWSRIIENSFAPLYLGRFDVVIGNPPWLTWSKMPATWRAQSEEKWRDYGLWRVPIDGRTRSRNHAMGDIAILVAATALERYVAPNGVVALLVPKSLITADPGGRAFRKFRLTPDTEDRIGDGRDIDVIFSAVHLEDWSAVHPFAPEAANSPVFLVMQRDREQQYPVETVRWTRRPGSRIAMDWRSTSQALLQTRGSSQPVDIDRRLSAWSFTLENTEQTVRGITNDLDFGIGLHTRGANGIFFVRIVQATPDGVVIENIPTGRADPPPLRRGVVERDLVYPLLRGRDVSRWRAQPSGFIIAPYEENALDRLVPEPRFSNQFSNARRWLRQFLPLLRERATPPRRQWHLEGTDWCRLEGPLQYMAWPFVVVVREQQSRPAAAIVERTFIPQLGRSATVLIDHKLVFCGVQTRAEAVYLASMINSHPLQLLLTSFANTIAISPQTLRRLPIPSYDVNDEAIREIVALGDGIIETVVRGAVPDEHALNDAVTIFLTR